MLIKQFHIGHWHCLSGGGGHEHEPVPSVLVLSGPGGCLSGIHGALLLVLKIYQAEVQSRLVKTSTIGPNTFGNHTQHQEVFSAAVEGGNLGSSSTGFDTEPCFPSPFYCSYEDVNMWPKMDRWMFPVISTSETPVLFLLVETHIVTTLAPQCGGKSQIFD